MPEKLDPDATPGIKLLRVFRKLLLNGQKHFQSDLAAEFNCSPQTIIRIMGEIEAVMGIRLECGYENRKKWYRIASRSPRNLGLDYEELRYLSVCRDLAAQTLPSQILTRVDDTIFNISLHLAGRNVEKESPVSGQPVSFFSKGRIDYSRHFRIIENLLSAIAGNNVCRVTYRALNQEDGRIHDFVPHKLMGLNNTLYVLGATVDKDDGVIHFLNLAVHRIEKLKMTAKTVAIEFPEISNESFGLPWHEPRLYRIYFKPGNVVRYVKERIWSSDQIIEDQEDGGIILQLSSCSEPELMAWVRSFGDEAILLDSVQREKMVEPGL